MKCLSLHSYSQKTWRRYWMDFNRHTNLEGKHAFLSASPSTWVNYSDKKLRTVYNNLKAKQQGTVLHEFANTAITNRIKLARLKQSLNQFVNDAIGFRMESELVLYYSDICFGTADAISFTEQDNGRMLLRIFDLKTGYIKVTFRQLDVYAALFCLEYEQDPYEIDIQQRIYQNNEIFEQLPDPENIKAIMEKIVRFDKVVSSLE